MRTTTPVRLGLREVGSMGQVFGSIYAVESMTSSMMTKIMLQSAT
jgi:hypothetical protein